MAYTKEQIVAYFNNRRTRSRAVEKALLHLNSMQTYDEQRDRDSKYANKRGFSQADAKAGTRDALYIINNGSLSLDKINYWMEPNCKGVPRITKYWRQLLKKANNER